ncbi:MAG: hypothetical protein HDQ44_02935 [Desulfovibrio sp.]|nr:hypothetical protein [Desulfovibrio sp.]
MAICPHCKAKTEDGAAECPACGKTIPASDLEQIQTSTSGWQKFVILAATVLLILIGFTFYGAEDREDKAAQQNFAKPVADIIRIASAQTGLGDIFGAPEYQYVARPKSAEVRVNFVRGPLNQAQAAMFGQTVCAALARAYVRKGYMPRHLRVIVGGSQPGGHAVYGQAVFNGNIDALGWEPAAN